MQQVFSILPVMADDHAAYLAFHKAESEKRLNAQKSKQQPPTQEKKPNPAPRRRDTNISANKSNVEKSLLDNIASIETKGDQAEENDAGNADGVETDETGAKSVENELSQMQSSIEQEGNDQQDDDDEEECSPERLEEIKKILIDIYEKYSPEKLNKIDRLLAKYIGHEEEFLQFVFSKYNVSPVVYPSLVKPSLNIKYGYGPQPAPATNDQTASNTENEGKMYPNSSNDNEGSKDNIDGTETKSGSSSMKSNNNNARDVSSKPVLKVILFVILCRE